MSHGYTYSTLIQSLHNYGEKISKFKHQKINNAQRIANNKIDDTDFLNLHDKLLRHDRTWFVIRWFYRLFTNVEKQRSLLVYACLQKLTNHECDNSSNLPLASISKKKLREIFLIHAPRVSYFSGIRSIAQWLYHKMTQNSVKKKFNQEDLLRGKKAVDQLAKIYQDTEKKCQSLFMSQIPLNKLQAKIEQLKKELDKKSLQIRLPFEVSLWEKNAESLERLTQLWTLFTDIINNGEIRLQAFFNNEFSLVPYTPAASVHYVARNFDIKYLREDYKPLSSDEMIRKMQVQGWQKLFEIETLIAIKKFEVGYKFVPRHAHWWRFSQKKWLRDILNDPEVRQNHSELEKLRKEMARQYHPDVWPQPFKHEAEYLFKEFEKAFKSYKRPFDKAQRYLNGEVEEFSSILHNGKPILFLQMIKDYKIQGKLLVKGLKELAVNETAKMKNAYRAMAADLAFDRVDIWRIEQDTARLEQKNIAERKQIHLMLAKIAEHQKRELNTRVKNDEEDKHEFCHSYPRRRSTSF